MGFKIHSNITNNQAIFAKKLLTENILLIWYIYEVVFQIRDLLKLRGK